MDAERPRGRPEAQPVAIMPGQSTLNHFPAQPETAFETEPRLPITARARPPKDERTRPQTTRAKVRAGPGGTGAQPPKATPKKGSHEYKCEGDEGHGGESKPRCQSSRTNSVPGSSPDADRASRIAVEKSSPADDFISISLR